MTAGRSAAAFDPAPWQAAIGELGLDEPAGEALSLPIALRRRRSFSPRLADPRASVSLVDDDGVLRWVYRPPASDAPRERVRRAGLLDWMRPLARIDYHDIGPNEVTAKLAALDARLTPQQGLRRWSQQQLAAAPTPQVAARALLLVHGTFSASEMWFGELGATAPGQQLLAQWQAVYGANVFAFDHPTLSVAPWLNALDLARQLAAFDGPIDVLCHSRGGLVASWLLRLADVPVERVVFVGSPLAGTSLASPHRLRIALDLLANVANALALGAAAAATVAPLAAGAAGLAKVLGKTLQLGSALPLADAAVALVPGLASQQRTDNNAEMERLFASPWTTQPVLSAVTADFEPDLSAPWWKFWTRFSDLGTRLADAGAELVFPGANDLVVDTESMHALGLGGPAIADVLALGKTPAVWHTSYFRDARVIEFLGDRLG